MRDLLSFLNTNSLVQPKILLVEDCQFDTVFIKHIVQKYCSYAIIDHATTKTSACQFLTSGKYDAILLDLNLPDTTSLQDVQEIRLLAPNALLVIVTGMATDSIIEQVKTYGANGIIGKDAIPQNNFSTMIHDAVDNINFV